MTTPRLIAHRGDAHGHPENSMAALASALESGIRYIECDLQINASGTLVVLHDADFERTHHCKLSVFKHVDGQEPELPTAKEVLELAAQYPDATFFFEIKHDSIDHWGDDYVLEKLKPLLASIGGHVLLARSAKFLAKARQVGFRSIGVIVREWSDVVRVQASTLEPDFLVVNIHRVPDGQHLWPGRWQWAVYEVCDIATAAAWGKRGADFVISEKAVQLHQQRQALPQ